MVMLPKTAVTDNETENGDDEVAVQGELELPRDNLIESNNTDFPNSGIECSM